MKSLISENFFKSKRILILGGMGFIGSNLAIRLAKLGAEISVVDSMLPQYGGNTANIEQVRDQVKINYSDIRDRHSMNYLVSGIDYIFSLAGQTSHIESMTDPFTDLDINCTSQLSLLESCKSNNPSVKIVYGSTRQLYGRPEYLPVDEKHPEAPVDVNGINKLAAEKYFALYSHLYGIKTVSLRLTNTYGPRQHINGDKQGFTGIFIRKALKGEKITIFGDGSQKRDFNYIDDVVDALLLCTAYDELNGRAFNLGEKEIYSILSFVEILRNFLQFEYETVPFPEDHKKIDIGDYYGDYSLFNSITSWEPKIGLEEGLGKTVEYFKHRIRSYF
jgi:UDP-glucose 4-epimerase